MLKNHVDSPSLGDPIAGVKDTADLTSLPLTSLPLVSVRRMQLGKVEIKFHLECKPYFPCAQFMLRQIH